MAGIGHTLRVGTPSGSLSCPKMCHELTKVGKSCSGKAKLLPYNKHRRERTLTEAEHSRPLEVLYSFLLLLYSVILEVLGAGTSIILVLHMGN